ncbi:hypothetical protein [Sphingomonas sp. DT-204]|uniref:hypothetical protein n=1 Tax=Sphingomonas sp. DT-204 TaxID=3396166 RepID=UPI003F1AC7A9
MSQVGYKSGCRNSESTDRKRALREVKVAGELRTLWAHSMLQNTGKTHPYWFTGDQTPRSGGWPDIHACHWGFEGVEFDTEALSLIERRRSGAEA